MGLRSLEQKACDRFLLLKLIEKASPLDRYQLQKLPFRAEYDLNTEKRRGFSYEFFQYDDGPISKEIYEDLDALKDLSLVSEQGITIQIEGRGKRLLSEFDHIFKENREITDKVDAVVRRFSKMSGLDLVDDTHKMRVVWNGKCVNLERIPRNSTIIPMPAEQSLEMESSILETLIALLSPQLIEDIRETRKEGSTSKPYRPLAVA